MDILITGGSGFLGSHLVDKLVEKNHKIRVIDLWKSAEIKKHEDESNLKFSKGSILDEELMKRECYGKDCIIHLAGILGTSESITLYNINDVIQINLVASVRLLDLVKEFGISKIIIPTTPNTPEKINPYKITKQALEKFCKLYHEQFGLEIIDLRLGNVYGSRERWLGCPFDAPYNYQKIIPTFIVNALTRKKIPIFGDGEQKSEYTYIDDVIEVFQRCIETKRRISGEVLEVGGNSNYSVNEILDIIATMSEMEVEREYLPMRPGEVKLDFKLDSKRLKEVLDYQVKWNIKEGLEKTIPYYRNIINSIDIKI